MFYENTLFVQVFSLEGNYLIILKNKYKIISNFKTELQTLT